MTASFGLTMDTGALIEMENGNRRVAAVWSVALQRERPITVPAVVVAEWWRGQHGPVRGLLDATIVEPMDESMAKLVGSSLRAIEAALKSIRKSKGKKAPAPSLVDVAVVASAATRGDIVYTTDPSDLFFVRDTIAPSVRVLGI